MTNVKLSEKQKEVIRLMQNGYSIYNRPGGYVRVSKTLLSFQNIHINPSTLTALLNKLIVKRWKHLESDTVYVLTQFGKSLPLQ
jgi:hypothetical protein